MPSEPLDVKHLTVSKRQLFMYEDTLENKFNWALEIFNDYMEEVMSGV